MPKKTFFNLSEERQNEILNIAYEEFVKNSYKHASLNIIIKNSGVAKGSFYRYFSDKMDLYKYLIDSLNMVGGIRMITLREITRENYIACLLLKVKTEQENFVATNAISLAKAKYEPECIPIL